MSSPALCSFRSLSSFISLVLSLCSQCTFSLCSSVSPLVFPSGLSLLSLTSCFSLSLPSLLSDFSLWFGPVPFIQLPFLRLFGYLYWSLSLFLSRFSPSPSLLPSISRVVSVFVTVYLLDLPYRPIFVPCCAYVCLLLLLSDFLFSSYNISCNLSVAS